MRFLTVTRAKKFAGSLMPIKFYIEDAESGDTEIKGVRTRKLLELKNGETKTVSIGENAVKLFAIADKASKDWCVDVKQIPEGTEPVSVSGENHVSMSSGNAFRFHDNENDPYVQEVRSGGKRKGGAIMIGSIVFGLLIGIALGVFIIRASKPKVKDQTFTKDGLTVTLTNQFEESEMEPFNAVYLNEKRGIAVMTSTEWVPAAYSLNLRSYTDLLIKSTGQSVKNRNYEKDRSSFEYEFTNPENNITYYYRVYVYNPSTDVFWVVNFSTPVKQWEKNVSDIEKWESTITFGK